MSTKLISILALAVAVVAAGVSAIVVTNNRAAAARALTAKAEAEEGKAKAEARKAAAEQAAAEARAAEKKAEQKTSEANAARARDERLKSDTDARTAAEEAKRAEAERETARKEAQKAADYKTAEREKANAARAVAEAEAEKARQAAKKAEADAAKEAARLATEKTKNDGRIAEAKLLELQRIDFETLARELAEFKRDLDEREAALRPEKTAADLQWVAEREPDEIGGETNAVRRKTRVLPENDVTLPVESRRLAKAERLKREAAEERALAVSNRIVTVLSKRYADAIVNDRVVEANYYLKNIRMYYPNWKADAKLFDEARAALPVKKEEGNRE